ncbi:MULTISPECIES: TetR/AcrR family transcriptional regulator [Chryseobacterium]|jgi:AcrR family transcriptional regulator|uniref:AcrR family transcriptional regulator n=1 Tax=Chryseobacterium rhizosphaerae TaxID=395937 RepID=A0AAE4C3C7_9FLAO|nr:MULTISPECIES: TetR/AcrR family transcriptional regulator [Chryseobacterium]MBL3548567.1 TetR/AcrR family transcriptional regulator [Chryseobacterium sp. KMC2]MDC8102737.1 TetR/AcrR family transcriptional regulator [Chryseobacterium rhizosphaerae]MDR6526459.1 AcrR family transcriptional regulator [Chryseobacterium rhizosphaerae]MDR6546028.1 AcrR family transcriptional regulator [Chryseobacterium rhizosphaerae]REC77724.1 TetR/AcrR family transcriptional regulator [Chryseobacterium rhizosphaer
MKKKFTEKQIHILDIAEELIAKKGYEGTSVRDICSKANINVAMISYYFGSKEKMMSYLYQYRVLKTRENFSEFADTIKEGKPEMQMREMIKYIVSQLFKYNYFHGFVTQELRHTENLKDELLDFYQLFVRKLDEVIKKGVASGVFTFTPKPEDILTMIIGSTLFVIRNKNFYELYVPSKNEETYAKEAEKKVRMNLLLSVFAILGYAAD